MGAGDDEVGVDLFEGLETWASAKQNLVGWRVRQGRRALELFGFHETLP